MKYSNKIILAMAVCIILWIALPGWCGLGLKKVGQAGMQFLKLRNGARTLAMGNTGIAELNNDGNALFINPATITNVKNNAMSLNFCDYWLDANLGSFAFVKNFDDIGSVGFSVFYLNLGEFEETLEDIQYQFGTGRTFTAGSFTVGLAYAKQMTDRFSIGGHLMYARDDLDFGNDLADRWDGGNKDNASNFIVDFGTYYDTGFRSLRVAVVLQNFGPDIKYINEKTSMPITFRIGASMDFPVFSDKNLLSLAVESVNPRDFQEVVHLGAEYRMAGLIALRGGYKLNYDVESYSGGIGLQYKIGSMIYVLDISYGAIEGPLSDLMTFSLSLLF